MAKTTIQVELLRLIEVAAAERWHELDLSGRALTQLQPRASGHRCREAIQELLDVLARELDLHQQVPRRAATPTGCTPCFRRDPLSWARARSPF